MNVLEKLARDCVGDGQEPNLFFVTDTPSFATHPRVLAVVTTSKEQAIEVAELLGASHVEDRQEGLVWER